MTSKASNGPEKKKSKYALPSFDEQSQLNSTESILSTNLLNLEVNELLDEVKCNKKQSDINALDDCIESLKAILTTNTKKYSSQEISSKWIQKKKIENLSLVKYNDLSVVLQFQPPSSVEMIGSYPTRTDTAPLHNIDFAVHMDKDCFEERDILNYVYFDKRALYLAVLVQALRDAKFAGDVDFAYFKGCPYKTIIIIKPNLPGWNGLQLRIIPTISANIFKVTQLLSSKNNIRPRAWLEELKNAVDTTNSHLDPSQLKPTANYNNAVAEDIAIMIQHKIISSVTSMSPVIKQVIVLMKVWLTQRQLRYGLQGFDSHMVALLVAYLFQTKRINASMAAMTAFQVILKFISETIISSALSFSAVAIQHDIDDISTGVALYHPIGSKEKFIEYNAFWRVSVSTWQMMKQDATNSISSIQSFDHDSTFRKLFLSKVSILDREDMLFHVSLPHEVALSSTLSDDEDDHVDEPVWSHISHHIYSILKQALDDRILSLSVIINPSHEILSDISLSSTDQFQLSHPSSSHQHSYLITIGITLALDKAGRKVDRGPSYEHADALQAYRDFWGSKCQLRRFQDGTIVEAVVWEGLSWLHPEQTLVDTTLRGPLIVGEIMRYILSVKYPMIFGDAGEHISSASLEFEENQRKIDSISLLSTSSTSPSDVDLLQSCKKTIEALDALRTILASRITGMPIMIESLQGLDPELRYTSLYPPIPHPLLSTTGKDGDMNALQGKKLSLQLKPLLILGTLESSGKWPHDVEAVKMLKIGILLKIFELLKDQYEVHSVVHHDSIDIMYQGYLFRLMLISDKEREYGLSYTSSRPMIPNLHVSYLVSMSIHHQAIRSLVASYPCYADTVRYTIKWMNESGLTGLCSHAIIELIVAAIFIDPFPKSMPPSSSTIAFLQVLRFMSEYDWKNTPLILNMDHSITTTDRHAINTSFQAYRQQCRSHGIMRLPMYIVPSYNRTREFNSMIWDYDLTGPDLSIIVKSAKAAYIALANQLSNIRSYCNNDMDTSSLSNICGTKDMIASNYNVILKFHHDLSTIHQTNVGVAPQYAVLQTYKNTPIKTLSTRNLVVKWSSSMLFPIQEEIIDKLRQRYGRYALFFWNGNKGDEIGITWKPSLFLPKKFTMLESALRQPILSNDHSNDTANNTGLTIPNTAELLANIVSCCDGYVASFELV